MSHAPTASNQLATQGSCGRHRDWPDRPSRGARHRGLVGVAATASEPLSASQLRRLLNAQDLPTTELLPVTKESHPFNGAAWQNKPINLAKYGYVEHEYLLSGKSNVYDSSPNGNFELRVLRSGEVTTRMLVRQPKKMEKWSGKVNVEIINPTSNYDFTAVWSALWSARWATTTYTWASPANRPSCRGCSSSTRSGTPISRGRIHYHRRSRHAPICRETRATTRTFRSCTRTAWCGTSLPKQVGY